MTRDEFLSSMRANNVREDAYSLEAWANDCYTAQHLSTGWAVFYTERGTMTGVRDFALEADALDYLNGLMLANESRGR